MTGIQRQAVKDIFAQLEARAPGAGPELSVLVSYFEIYGGRCQVCCVWGFGVVLWGDVCAWGGG